MEVKSPRACPQRNLRLVAIEPGRVTRSPINQLKRCGETRHRPESGTERMLVLPSCLTKEKKEKETGGWVLAPLSIPT